jgi:mannitol operon repressor
VVLVATAFVDDLLGRLLAAFLLENESSEILLNGFNAPLGTLATKIAGCHAMGLITDGERLECHLLRRVRNEFAHQVKASFADNKIRDLCSNLTISEAVKESTKSPRQQFARAAITLMVGLLNRPHYVRQRPLKYGQWEQTAGLVQRKTTAALWGQAPYDDTVKPRAAVPFRMILPAP